MKLYLSSYKFGNHPERLSQLSSENKKAVVMTNALDFSTDLDRRSKSEKDQLEVLTSLGFIPEMLDLRNYFDRKEELKVKIESLGLIWVHGGNTFLLRTAMAKSGFDNILKDYSHREDKKNFIYAGFSAGISILAPSLKGIEFIDDPEFVKKIYNQEADFNGLGIVDYSIVPHFESDHPESETANLELDYLKKNDIAYKTLSDGDVIIFDTLHSMEEGKVKSN